MTQMDDLTSEPTGDVTGDGGRRPRRVLRIATAASSLVAGSVLVATLSPVGTAGAHPAGTDERPVVERAESDEADGKRRGRMENSRSADGATHRRHFVGIVTEVLDLDREALREALRGGATLADLAGDRTDELVAELAASATDRIEGAVADGRLTRERADELLARVVERAEARVHHERPARPMDRGRHAEGHGAEGHGHGHHGDHDRRGTEAGQGSSVR